MQSRATLVPVEEYLRTSFPDGDREYVDGRIVERNAGEKDHSRTQRELIRFFLNFQGPRDVFVFPEQRVQVKPTRFRVPDVCVYLDQEPEEQIFRTPPFLVIEILSPDDRASELQEKVEEYLQFGSPFVWVMDPRTRRAWVHAPRGSQLTASAVWTENPRIELPLEEVFP